MDDPKERMLKRMREVDDRRKARESKMPSAEVKQTREDNIPETIRALRGLDLEPEILEYIRVCSEELGDELYGKIVHQLELDVLADNGEYEKLLNEFYKIARDYGIVVSYKKTED